MSKFVLCVSNFFLILVSNELFNTKYNEFFFFFFFFFFKCMNLHYCKNERSNRLKLKEIINFLNLGAKWPSFIMLSVEIEMNISSSQLLNIFVYKHELRTNIYLKLKFRENSIRFQLWANFVSCVHLSFWIFIPSELINAKY